MFALGPWGPRPRVPVAWSLSQSTPTPRELRFLASKIAANFVSTISNTVAPAVVAAREFGHSPPSPHHGGEEGRRRRRAHKHATPVRCWHQRGALGPRQAGKYTRSSRRLHRHLLQKRLRASTWFLISWRALQNEGLPKTIIMFYCRIPEVVHLPRASVPRHTFAKCDNWPL